MLPHEGGNRKQSIFEHTFAVLGNRAAEPLLTKQVEMYAFHNLSPWVFFCVMSCYVSISHCGIFTSFNYSLSLGTLPREGFLYFKSISFVSFFFAATTELTLCMDTGKKYQRMNKTFELFFCLFFLCFIVFILPDEKKKGG